ncbi:hypothetical protein Btru_059134 [Bulinus truncatus]|nr:hypothetical protein Btru_059134 [Bulinus truncatus]
MMFSNRCCWWLRLTAALLCSSISFHLCQADCSINTPINVLEDKPIGTIIGWVASKSLRIDKCRDDPQYNQQLVTEKVKEGNWSVKINREFDAETMPSALTFDLTCVDADDTRSSLDITVIINDVDEFAPEFSQPVYEIQIPEDTPIQSTVFSFSKLAKDKDISAEATSIQYILTSNANGAFIIIDQYNGAVQLEKNLDFESGNILYTLNVSAQDVNNVLRAGYAVLRIRVTDVDDLNPFFDQDIYYFQIQEGTYSRSELFKPSPALSARDGDTAINQTIYFSLDLSSKAQYNNLFDIDKNGSLSVNGTVKPGKYSINVRAYQLDKPEFRYAVAILVLTVTDINNNKPVLSSNSYTADVSELSPLGTTVLTVSASDLDEGDNAVFKFWLLSDVSSFGVFDIVTDQSLGYIILNQTLDREKVTSYKFQVYAKETKTQELFESQHSNVTIKVLDENDNSPVFTSSYYSFRINRTATGVIGQVSATDADAPPNGDIVYSLQTSLFSSAVAINSKTGRISLTRNLLQTDVGTYSMIAQATDSSLDISKRRSSLAAVVVQVTPVNDNAPSFVSSQPYIFNVPEITPANSLIGQISAVDSDGDSVQYFIKSGNEDNYVRLDSASGQLYLIKENDLDSSSVVTSYLTLIALASDGLYNTTTVVHVQFTYVNEFDPVFTSVPVGTVAEDSRKGTNITKVVATDKDKDSDGVLTYSLVPLSYSSIFSIDSQTGWIFLACDGCLSYDTRRSYDLVVKAVDGTFYFHSFRLKILDCRCRKKL